jgi:long-chain acyl-CoA synthetase
VRALSYAVSVEASANLKTYNEYFAAVVEHRRDAVAVRLKTPSGYRQMTYGELHRQVLGVAYALLSKGLKPHERAAILSENRPEWVVSYLGVYFARGAVVPLDPLISPEEWRRLLDDSESQVVFVSGLLLDKLREAVSDSPLRDRIVCFDSVAAGSGIPTLSDFVAEGLHLAVRPELPESTLSDVVVILYTSGTTGRPKGVMLTQENIVSEITAALQTVRVDENEILLCLLPLQHVLASVINFLLPMYLGAQVVFADTLKRSEILAAMQEAGITVLATVPQFFYLFHERIREELAQRGKFARGVFRALLGINRFCRRRLHLNAGKLLFGSIHRTFGSRMRLFVSGGSAFDPKVAQEFHDLGFTILQGYGLTETTGAATITPVERNVIGSVGPALPGMEVAILEPGEGGIGEVAIRGPVVMKGYYKNPEATAEAMPDGWFHSGDLGWIDEGGNLFITGREKEVIVLPSGKNIYPDELEAHYEKCPFIREIAVLGIAASDHQGAERLHGVVVPDFDALKAKRIANAREILHDQIGKLSHQLPQYKRLMSYQIQKDPLPRTTTRKLKRLELKRMIESGMLRETESAGGTQEVTVEDREWFESAAGQEVLSALREGRRQDVPVRLDMNLELDLGFDSMERVELMASLEQSLGLALPEGFGADIHTVRDLIQSLQLQVGDAAALGTSQKQSWGKILSAASLAQEDWMKPRFSGTALRLIEYAVLRMVWLIFKLCFRFEASGLNHLPRAGTFLICPNHVSFLDAFIVMAPLPFHLVRRTFFVGAAEFFVNPLMRLVAYIANIIPVDPDEHLLRAMKAGAYGLHSGRVLCIFPEGARSFDGRLGPFKKGAAILAREIGVPMVPVAIHGAYEAWPRAGRRIRLHKLKVVFGEPLWPGAGLEDTSYEAGTDRLKQALSELLEN